MKEDRKINRAWITVKAMRANIQQKEPSKAKEMIQKAPILSIQ